MIKNPSSQIQLLLLPSIQRFFGIRWLFFITSLLISCSADADFPDWQVSKSFVVDHRCTNIESVPIASIQKARQKFVIAYGHTSHGSQIVDGMSQLDKFMQAKGCLAGTFSYNTTGNNDALRFFDTPFSGASDLGNPNRTAWATATQNYLKNHPEVNVVMWSWCGQVSNATATDISTYLQLMSQLEKEYPAVRFVYMTGHLDGTGEKGNLHQRNEQIRNYCTENNKILFDFADIESYDPDEKVNYMLQNANDNCDYDSDGNGSRDKNWATDWQASHKKDSDWYSCSSAHSQPLNANRKAFAFWYLLASLAENEDITNNSTKTIMASNTILCRYMPLEECFNFSKPVSVKELFVIDLNGRNVIHLQGEKVETDKFFLNVSLSNGSKLSSVYFYRIITETNIFSGKIQIR